MTDAVHCDHSLDSAPVSSQGRDQKTGVRRAVHQRGGDSHSAWEAPLSAPQAVQPDVKCARWSIWDSPSRSASSPCGSHPRIRLTTPPELMQELAHRRAVSTTIRPTAGRCPRAKRHGGRRHLKDIGA